MAKTRTVEGVGIGWKPELASRRDFVYSDRRPMRPVDQLPRLVPPSDKHSPVRNQGGEGACVGHGVAAAADFITRTDGDRYDTLYGPRFAYNMARLVEDQRDHDGASREDGGAYVRDGMDALRRVGALPESLWKYRPKDGRPEGYRDYAIVPSESRQKKAQSFRVETNRCNTAEDVLNAIADGHPVVAGFTCFTSWWTPAVDRSGICPMPDSRAREDGGHCTLWCAYDLDFDFGQGVVGGIGFKNSWSEKWGNAFGRPGYGMFPVEFIRRQFADDMWVAIRESA